MKTLPPVALGTWSWGTGFAGGDTVFGNHLSDTQMAEVFTAAMSKCHERCNSDPHPTPEIRSRG